MTTVSEWSQLSKDVAATAELWQALREQCLAHFGDYGSMCKLCGGRWGDQELEQHVESCLAAPIETAE